MERAGLVHAVGIIFDGVEAGCRRRGAPRKISERAGAESGLSWCTRGMNVELVFRTAAGEWESLLERDAAGEPDAEFVLLVERQSRFVFRIAYAVLRRTEDAEDVVQETFFKLYRTGAWRGMRDERAFLARAAWRLAIGKRPDRGSGTGSEGREIASRENTPETAAIEREWSRKIHGLIDALPEKLRRPLALSSLEELTTSEIAVVMRLPEGTVRRRLTEARALLKEKMARMEGSKHA